jgi:aspartate/tyrosine/aromatic aminotransferase
MSSDGLYAEWVAELKVMSGRIIAMRAQLRKAIEDTGAAGDYSYITKQIGMFAYTGLSAEQVERLEKEFHIYMVKSGRISMAGAR